MEKETDESNESDPIFTIYVLHMYIIYTYTQTHEVIQPSINI